MKLKQRFQKVLLGVGLLTCANTFALPNLMSVYQDAVNNDPTFKQAFNTYLSAKEAWPQALANMLPSVNINGNWAYVNVNNSSNNPFSGNLNTGYRQRDYALNISQPVFNYSAWVGLQQADNVVKKAQASYDDALQSLILRTATAYFKVLQAKDNVRFSKAQQDANGRSLEQARQRFKVGLDAIASVYEAQAAFDSSRALCIAAKNNLSNQFENLRLITNQVYGNLAGLKSSYVPLVTPKPNKKSDWTKIALKQNLALKAAQYATFAAKQNISINNASHLPSVILSAAHNHSENDSSVSFLHSDNNTNQAKLTLSFPVYSGGLVVSKTRQATYDYQTAHATLEQVHRATIVNTRISYNNIIDGISTIKADKQAVKSAQNTLESTSAQFKVGTRTMVDVVTSQKNLFQKQTQLAADQYQYILALLQLKYQAGTLSTKDLQNINQWLSH